MILPHLSSLDHAWPLLLLLAALALDALLVLLFDLLLSAGAALLVVVLPEKLQVIQEYRFLLYAAMVIAVLLFRPEGLLPRPVRQYFPGWRPGGSK